MPAPRRKSGDGTCGCRLGLADDREIVDAAPGVARVAHLEDLAGGALTPPVELAQRDHVLDVEPIMDAQLFDGEVLEGLRIVVVPEEQDPEGAVLSEEDDPGVAQAAELDAHEKNRVLEVHAVLLPDLELPLPHPEAHHDLLDVLLPRPGPSAPALSLGIPVTLQGEVQAAKDRLKHGLRSVGGVIHQLESLS